MRQIVYRRQARREFDEAGDWYEKERTGLGMEFLAEIQQGIRCWRRCTKCSRMN